MQFEKEKDIHELITEIRTAEARRKILEAISTAVGRAQGLTDNVGGKNFGTNINKPEPQPQIQETPVEIQLNNKAVDQYNQYTKDEIQQVPGVSHNDGDSINILNEIGNVLKKPFSGEHKTVKVIAALAFFLALPYVGSALRSGHHVETGASQFPNGYEQGISEQPVLHEGQFDPNTLNDIQHLEELKNQEKT